MKKTKKLILGSALAIGFCTSLMVGTTYALFTSESEVNIAVTSANVSLSAKVDADSVFTKQLDAEYQAGVLGTYCGNVKVEENGDVTFANVVTGDAIKFDIVMSNTSSIAVKYRTAWECDNAEMLKSLTFKVNNAVCVAGTGLWKPLAVGEAPEKLTVEIEMNDVADATVQHTCTLAFRVEAVQGNGDTIGNSYVATSENFASVLSEAKSGDEIVLDGDVDSPTQITIDSKDLNIDLNGHTLSTKKQINANGNSKVVISNGELFVSDRNGLIAYDNTNVTLNNVKLTMDEKDGVVRYGMGVYNSASVTVNGGEIYAGALALSTNATIGNYNPDMNVVLNGVKLSSKYCALLYNVNGTLKLNNCELSAYSQAAVIRGGNVTMNNCKLTKLAVAEGETDAQIIRAGNPDTYAGRYNGDWGNGNNVPDAVLTVGNRSTSYQHATNLTINEVTIVNETEQPDIYVYGNATEDIGTTLSYSAGIGNVVIGGGQVKTIVAVSDTEQAQAALDNASDGDTVVLKAGNYGALSFGQVKALSEVNGNTYTRTLNNVTIEGGEGVVVNGLTLSGGHVYGTENNPITDPITGITTSSTVNSYYSKWNVNNLTIKGVTFTSQVNIVADSAQFLELDGFKMTDCHYVGTTTVVGDGGNRLFRLARGKSETVLKNIVIENCTVDTAYQGIYVYGDRDITVKDCTFNNLGHNAIGIQNTSQGGVSVANSGTVVIEGNKISNVKDRAFRVGALLGGSILYKNNIITNSGDDEGENFKAVSIAEGATITFTGNTKDGADWNPQDVQANVGY